jgi:AcrR family transcriptional regulator
MKPADAAPALAYTERILVEAGLVGENTGALKRSNKRGELMRERIVQAAVDCFTEYGYTRTRISDITHRAGTSQGNFYRHFASLDNVFLAALAPALDDLAHASGRQDRRQGELENLIESSTAYLNAYVCFARRQPSARTTASARSGCASGKTTSTALCDGSTGSSSAAS